MKGKASLAWGIILLCWALVVSAATPPRALLLIWDSANDQSVETHLRLVQRLKELRASGHFSKVAGLDRNIKVYDCSQQSHLGPVKQLGRSRADAPYLAIVRLDKTGLPVAIEWGSRVSSIETAVNELDTRLGLALKPVVTPTPTVPPSNGGAHEAFLNAQGFYRKGEYQPALEQFTVAIELAPTALLYCRRGDCKLHLRDQAGGLVDLEKSLRLDPDFAEALYLRGLTLYNAAQYRSALPDLNRLLTRDPNHASALAMRGECKRLLGENGAQADLDRALELDPTQLIAWNGRGILWLIKGQPEKGISDFDRALKLNPRDAFALTFRGAGLVDLKSFPEAIADLDQAVQVAPTLARGYYHRARAKEGLKDFKGAIADADQAIRLDPKSGQAFANRGFYKLRIEDLEGALNDCNEAIKCDPRQAPWWRNRAAVWDRLGKAENAQSDRNQAHALDGK